MTAATPDLLEAAIARFRARTDYPQRGAVWQLWTRPPGGAAYMGFKGPTDEEVEALVSNKLATLSHVHGNGQRVIQLTDEGIAKRDEALSREVPGPNVDEGGGDGDCG